MGSQAGMADDNDALRQLREALALSPDNVPLRLLLAGRLIQDGQLAEAESEYRSALAQEPDNRDIKTGLALSFFLQKRDSEALVVIEDLLAGGDVPARALIVYARLLERQGDMAEAAEVYYRALAMDAEVRDAGLQTRLEPHRRETPPSLRDEPEDDEEADEAMPAPVEFEGGGPAIPLERSDISFEDVGGMEALKEEIRIKIIYPLKHREMFEAYGKKAGGGILMYGPPGCGKTYMARATAGEVDASFLVIGIHDVLDMWIGQSERNLHAVFEQARNNRPCVLFFDEVDALGASRTDMRKSGARQLINQFLSEMDGVGESNEGVLVLAATNAPWHLDPAFRRPGRFDNIIFVPPPDEEARASILRLLLRDKPAKDIDFGLIAKKTAGFSGADLKAIVETAVDAKLQEAMRKGVPTPLETRDLRAAAKRRTPTTGEWFNAARNYALYANQAGIYDDILAYLNIKS